MKWIDLKSDGEWSNVLEASKKAPVVVFKHSTRCSISLMAKKNLERFWEHDIAAYYLDLIQYRAISNKISTDLDVQHQSPQLILISNGIAIYDASHSDIDADALAPYLAKV